MLNSQCAGIQVCGFDGQCRDQCATDRDCTVGESCASLMCAVPSELTDAGTFPVPDGGSAVGAPCSYNSDCPLPLVCRAGKCAYECLTDRDCTPPLSCIDHLCALPGVDAGSASDASDAGTATEAGAPEAGSHDASVDTRGLPCKSDGDCQDGLVCDGVERCLNGFCAGATRELCDPSDICMKFQCVEPGICTITPNTGFDVDLDGHYAIGALCGTAEPADDCNDNDNRVYPGHPEACDQIDNNCNGIVDEGLWNAPTTFVSLSTSDGGAPFPVNPDAYTYDEETAMTRFADGTFAVVGAADESSGDLTAWHLDGTASVIAGAGLARPTSTDCTGARRLLGSTAATDGTNLLASTMFINPHNVNGCCNGHGGGTYEADSVVALVPESLSGPSSFTLDVEGPPGGSASCVQPFDWSYARPAGAAWVASRGQYAIAWADSHAVTTFSQLNVYVAWLDAAGNKTFEQPVLAASSDSQTPMPYFTDVLVASAPAANTIMVAYSSSASTGVRVVLLDPAGLGLLAGPVDVPALGQPNVFYPGALVYTGSAYVLATTDNTGLPGHVLLTRLDPSTGSVTAQVVIPVNGTGGQTVQPHLAVVGKGLLLTYVQGNGFAYLWTPESLPSIAGTNPPAGAFSTTIVPLGAPITGVSVAAVDAQHVLAAWSDGNMKATVLTCMP
jgi:hypothetical protein